MPRSQTIQRRTDNPIRILYWKGSHVSFLSEHNDLHRFFRIVDVVDEAAGLQDVWLKLHQYSYDALVAFNPEPSPDDIRQMRALFPELVIILCAGVDAMESAWGLIEAGADDCVFAGAHFGQRIARQLRFVLRRQKAFQDMQRLRIDLDAERLVNERQQDFIALVSHEFRTPLTIISSATQLLVLGVQSEQPSQALLPRVQKIQNSLHRLSRLIDSVTVYYKMEGGAWPMQSKPFSIHALLRDLCEQMNDMVGSHRVLLDSMMEGITFHGDEKICESICENIIGNALKYSPPDMPVVVSLYGVSEGCRIRVVDQGAGITQDALAHIGERFNRAGATSLVPGSGLGLHLSMKFAKAHGGHIYICSAEGQGTTADITLKSLSHT